jgi:very-short-patch-repair endonuclease
MNVVQALRERGGIASTAMLETVGVSPRQVERAAANGTVDRLRRGWYAVPDASKPVVRAVRAGGALACVSALDAMGVWTMPDPRLHVVIPRGTRSVAGTSIRLHRSKRERTGFPVETPAEALECALTCTDVRASVVLVDSVLNRRLLPRDQVERICARSARGRRVLALSDARSESGIETLARVALIRARVGVRTQAPIAGVGRVDLLIGDRLVLELDGEEWHDFEQDRARDRALTLRGYLVIRASYRQVVHGWPLVEAQILALVRRREHLWRAPHVALGHVPRGYRVRSDA